MNVHEIQYGRVTQFDVEPEHGEGFGLVLAPRSEAQLQFSVDTGMTLLRIGGRAWSIRGVTPRDALALTGLAEQDLPRLCWAAAVLPKSGDARSVLLQVHVFPAQHLWPDDIDVGVDEAVVDSVRRKHANLRTPQAVVDWLGARVLLGADSEGGFPRALLSSGPRSEVDRQSPFRLHGSGVAVDVARGEDGRLHVTRVVEPRRPEQVDERRPVMIVQARWRFCDATVAGEFRGVARTQLDQIVENESSYLRIWKEYNALERENILRRARALGWLRYDKCEELANGRWRFHLHADTKELDDRLGQLEAVEELELEAAAAPPLELLAPTPPREGPEEQERQERARSFSGTFMAAHATRRSVDVRPRFEEDRRPPKKGVLFMGLSGDRKRLARREEAHRSILAAECAMPQLGLLIENRPARMARHKEVQPLSPAARAAFEEPPNAKQEEALRVALSTPDIALIQGPPGTGKTKVIAALQVRLAELAAEEGHAGRNLLTSFQHDAVEHAASKTEVFGLPAIKVGRRHGQIEDDSVDGFDRWRRERIEKVRASLKSLPELPVSDVLRRVRTLTVAYVAGAGDAEEPLRLLEKVVDLTAGHLPQPLRERMLALLHQLRHGEALARGIDAEDRAFARKAVEDLRTTAAGFSDDGARSARRVLSRLGELAILRPQERELLERAGQWESEDEPPPFLAQLSPLRDALLDRLMPDERPAGAPTVNADVEALLSEVGDELYRRVRDSAAGVGSVLYEYLDDLMHDLPGLREAVRSYTVVLAATCQQSVSREMFLQKEGRPFTNVVVDEAARANPLDLFIPMARASRRIILVGDHRQLPHILESDVESQLDRSVLQSTQETLRKSLFERLYRSMEERTSRDGITRTVMLNVQYRMHPVLGEFVSRTFYEPHGRGFTSGRPDKDFVHGLAKYGGAVAAWYDLPLSKGPERGGRSKAREVEARWIVQEVLDLAKHRQDLSFGVISFYSAQVKEILRQMAEHGLTEQTEDGDYRIAPNWRETSGTGRKPRERLRVGTVDAFQGKEFDVVILSMTRSNELPTGDERALRRKYGHLMLENRLCVAMSRQQRLLIVVGDSAMVQGEVARSAIPGLVAFRQLCEGSHGLCLPT